MPPERPGLLVSVRDAVEAEAALAGGASIVDVKEPAHGPLGRAADDTMAEVMRTVHGRVPVSAALGELCDHNRPFPEGLSFVKWGLANCRHGFNWRKVLQARFALRAPRSALPVIVAYADWQCAQAPAVEEVCAFACQFPGGVFMIDTHCKEPGTLRKDQKPTLLDWLPLDGVKELCHRCREAKIRVALAGSLGPSEITALVQAKPDWFAVRGAVCEGSDRRGLVQKEKVQDLALFLASCMGP